MALPGAGGSGPAGPAWAAAARRQWWWAATVFSAASHRFFHRWNRSATWIACGAPVRMPSAYAPALSLHTVPTPGCSRSQAASVPASRSGSTSTGLRVSMSIKMVLYDWPAADREVVDAEHLDPARPRAPARRG